MSGVPGRPRSAVGLRHHGSGCGAISRGGVTVGQGSPAGHPGVGGKRSLKSTAQSSVSCAAG